MRIGEWAAVVAVALSAAVLAWAWECALTGSCYHAPALVKNAYWPYSVEMSVKDR